MTHLSEDDLVLLYYGEPGVPENARAHLAECRECRAAAESLAQTLDACDEWVIPESDAAFRRNVWARLEPKLDRRGALPGTRFWLAAAATAAMLVAAFFAGRISSRPAPTITAGLSQQARERILAISLADHLERAQTVADRGLEYERCRRSRRGSGQGEGSRE